MLVRRVSDGVTQSIGFGSDGLINDSALSTFSGGSELTVQVWYDQGPNGVDLEQTNSSYQPTIYDGSSVTVSTSGKPCVRIVRTANAGPGEWLQTDPVSLSTSGDMDVFLVLRGSLIGGGDRFFWNSQAGPTTSGARWGIGYGSSTYHQQPGPATNIGLGSLPVPDSLQFILNAQYNPSANINTLEGNGSEFGTNTSSTTYRTDPYNVTLAARTHGTEGYNTFDISEIIHLPTYDASENFSLGSNINSYYSFTNWSPTSGFLADYPGAAAAYSVRKLSNTAIKCMRVRRFVPPYDEQDIGFTAAGDLDEAAIEAFGGSDVLVVSVWYDQSGQSNHATQITPGSQPSIYDGVAVITEKGEPAIDFSSDFLSTAPFSATVSQPTTYFITVNKTNHSGYLFERSGTNGRQAQGDSTWIFAGGVAYGFYPTADLASQRLFTVLFDGANSISRMNSVATGSGNPGTLGQDGIQIGRAVQSLTGKVQEFIMYGADQTSKFTAIETNINSYFGVYTVYNPDPATSGFLFDYPDAAAAYSVRQLNNNATSAMRVMRAVPPYDEAEIGFVSGELDEQAIVDFAQLNGGNDVLRVSAWYDQSGQQNHALQDIKTSQPEIYNGTAVITVETSGKPGIFCADLNDHLEVTGAVDVTSRTIYQWSVYSLTGAGSYPTIKTKQLSDFHYVNTERPRTGVVRASTSTFDNAASAINVDQAYLRHSYADTTNVRTYLDGSSTPIIDITDANEDWDSADFEIFNSAGGSTGGITLSELVLWQSDESSNRPAIETNIMTYFNIP